VACLYMLCDVLHTVAKLQGSLQSKQIDLAAVPGMVESTLSRLRELKETPSSSTWFKDHKSVFIEVAESEVSDATQEAFTKSVYRPYIQGVIDHISSRLKTSDTFSAFSLFDPRHSPSSEDQLSTYGTETLQILTKFYGSEQRVTFGGETGISTPDIDTEATESEWKIFRRVMFSQFRNTDSADPDGECHEDTTTGLQRVTSELLTNGTLNAAFPNLACLAAVQLVLPVTTATVERSFSDMRLVKTRLRSRLGENTLDQLMRICIEGPDMLSDEHLEAIVNNWKSQRP